MMWVVLLALVVAAACAVCLDDRVWPVGLALVLALLPSAQMPVLGVSLLLVACAGVWLARPLPSSLRDRPGWIEVLAGALVAVSFFPLAGHGLSVVAVSDYVRWAAATLVVLALWRLSEGDLARVARVFACGLAVTATLAMLGLVTALAGVGGALGRFAVLAYAGSAPVVAVTSGGTFVRLAGPFGHPNSAAFAFAVGIILGAVYLRGSVRTLTVVVLVAATGLTLSRAGLAGLVLSVVVFVMLARGHRGARLAIGGGAAAMAGLVLSVGSVRARIGDSFGAFDPGTADRWRALSSFHHDMAGHWWLGRGFGAPEFVDPLVASQANLASNALLHTVLRGGLVPGLVLAALAVTALVAAWRHLRSGQLERTLLGAGTIGLILIPLQLDVPVVTFAPITAVFALLLAVLSRVSSPGEGDS